ncbi:MAG: ABC transporter ATP-binding protein [Xanthobacteraceae bacterium]|nr:ABC transporter ATP-binding protein [Xanthobacteraceae bacterium]
MQLEARSLTKSFGSFLAVDQVSIGVEPGAILGLIGPNGAGKSTLFNCLTGDILPTSGEVLIDGRNVTRLAPEERARRGLARTFQVPQTFSHMTVLENVMIGAFLHERSTVGAAARARAVIDEVGLAAVAGTPARTLGTPGRKRLEIARALATRPKVLLLDEAMAGLTPAEIQRAIALIRAIHARGVTLVVVEHIMEVILSLADRVMVLHQGREIARGTPAEVTGHRAVIEAYLGKRAAGRLAAAPSGAAS